MSLGIAGIEDRRRTNRRRRALRDWTASIRNGSTPQRIRGRSTATFRSARALRIRACNRNGIWDRQGVVFMLTQQPYFYQTRGFAAAMIAIGLLVVVSGYRLRVRQISRSLSARFDARLDERTRVARDLHDTLLQTVQGSKLVADHALKDPSDHERAVRSLQQLSAWLAQATDEGRGLQPLAGQSRRGAARVWPRAHPSDQR